jgi:hypothetical protein
LLLYDGRDFERLEIIACDGIEAGVAGLQMKAVPVTGGSFATRGAEAIPSEDLGWRFQGTFNAQYS